MKNKKEKGNTERLWIKMCTNCGYHVWSLKYDTKCTKCGGTARCEQQT